MAISQTNLADKTIAMVIVAEDGSGDYTDVKEGVDSLDSAGGWVFVKPGAYTISDSISITEDIWITGVGKLSVLTLADGVNDDMFKVTGGDGLLLKDLKLEGNQANQSAGWAVDQSVAGNLTITYDSLYVGDFKEGGINMSTGGLSSGTGVLNTFFTGNSGIDIQYVGASGLIMNNIFASSGAIGLTANAALDWSVSGIKIIANNFSGCSKGVYLNERSWLCFINSNWFNQCTTGIHLEGGTVSAKKFQYHRVLGNIMRSCTTGIDIEDSHKNNISHNAVDNTTTGYKETGTSDYNKYMGNTADNNTTNYSLLGSHNILRDNDDW